MTRALLLILLIGCDSCPTGPQSPGEAADTISTTGVISRCE